MFLKINTCIKCLSLVDLPAILILVSSSVRENTFHIQKTLILLVQFFYSYTTGIKLSLFRIFSNRFWVSVTMAL